MNVFIDKIKEGNSYVFMLSSGHHAITGKLVSADAVLEIVGRSVGVREDETHFLNPDHIVAVRPA